MDNQHQHIRGYRDLSAEEISQMNAVKALGETCGDMIEKMRSQPGFDQRWIAIAQTHLQQGFMAAVRAIAKPTTF
jgi:hypothetical protein